MNGMLDHALAYAKLGWRIVPVHHINGGGHCTCLRKCDAPGKHPRIKGWPEKATSDERTIRSWWARWPDANIGLATGHGLVDIETEGHGPGADNIEELERKLGPLLDTVTWTSGGGGTHRLYRTAAAIRNATSVGQAILGASDTGIDVRGEGGQAVLPPSNHHSGNEYRWGNLTPDAIDVAELPEAWAAFLLEAGNESRTAAHGGENVIPEGQRNATLARQAGTMRRVGMSEAAILAALVETNRERCRPPLPESEVRAVAASIARYEPDQVMVAAVEGHWEQDQDDTEERAAPEDPGSLPEHLLHVPGLVDEVMEHTLATAPFPDRTLAFCGALALQATLAGRKVRDTGGTRTSLYLLGLANSGTGKDHPRKINQRVMLEAGLSGQLADSFASGEGIEDRVAATRTVLFQTDEIDAVLLAISRSRDGRAERIMEILLKLFSASGSLYHMRVKAGQEPGAIDQPCVVLFGTAIPKHYYESHCEKMLTNGFFARMLVFEAGKRGAGQEPRELPVPSAILEKARYWAALRTGHGNLDNEHPKPIDVPLGPGVEEVFGDIRAQEVAAYDLAHAENDPIAMAIWARAGEKSRRLALVYACSENHLSPVVTREAAEWAWAIVHHQTQQMLFQAGCHVVENEFDARCKRMVSILQDWCSKRGDRWMEAWKISRRMKLSMRDLEDVRKTLMDQRLIEFNETPTGGRPTRVYRLVVSRRQKRTSCPAQEPGSGGTGHLLAQQEDLIDAGAESKSSGAERPEGP